MLKTRKLTLYKKIYKPCKHYWIIEPPCTVTSLGKCKYCGIVKEFVNNLIQYSYTKKAAGVPVSGDNELIAECYHARKSFKNN